MIITIFHLWIGLHNPIEHLWDYIKRELKKYTIKNLKELREKVLEIWYKIPKEVCQKLIDSMPRKFEAVIRANGKHTRY